MKIKNIVIISQVDCGYCDKLTTLLKKKKLESVEHTLTQGPESKLLKSFMSSLSINTVPAVFVDGTYVGGYTQMLDLLGKGK